MLSVLGEEMTMIKPAEMTFVHHFHFEECHEKLTGVCSLDCSESNPAHNVGRGKCDYCPMILDMMTGRIEGGQKWPLHLARNSPITLAEHVCGHYSINDGRHRICIAKRKRMAVWAVVLPEDNKCEICAGRPAGEDAELR